ncbi:MAG: ABC transporter substrate-binding protein [Vicinamibacterales bacterium]|jgi:peptide/nickel transport system substrate-binding protein|nr:ABC transporter substrate-binding protein [Vicinamibacterales bacterium]MDP6610092.1 ABC transporter substrate-binding protein [Vicinamibacterales bacterium]|tara:strand:+ start:3959 stop:5536 length:1578 start_codon:yes stop_codon:yes gene_type:complete
MIATSSGTGRRRGALTVLVLGLLGASLGCGGAPAPEARDTLVFAAPADATVLDPHNTTDSQSDQVVLMLFDTLITFDQEMNIVPHLAERWEVAEDQVTWTFSLREGVTFHDGSRFDAEAVRANFARVLDPEQNHKRLPLFEMIDHVEVIDDYTVNIVTAYPFGAFEPTMAHVSAAILSPAAAATHGGEFGRSAEATSGTGPYRVVRWTKDLEIVLERFDDYWGEAPPLRRVEYRPIPEAASRVIALEAGDVDVITHIPPTDLVRLEAEAAIDVHKVVSIGAQQFRFNHARPPFDDPRVVQAISYAIDRRAIVENLMPGLAEVSTGALTPIMRGYAELGEISQDQDRARQLLAEAGYPDGFSTTISTTPRYLLGVELAEVMAAQLADVGIEVDIDVLDWGSMVAFWEGLLPENNPQEIFIMGAGASTADADWGLRPIFLTHPTNENNYGYYSNAEFDRVIQEAMRATDPDARQALYRRAQEIVYLEDPGAVWLYDNYFILGARSSVVNITQSPLGVVTFERAAFRE